MLGFEALGVFALGQGTYSTPTIEVRRRGPIHRRRWAYDPDRIVREWEQAEAELQADIDAIEAAQEAARQAQEAKKAGQRKLKAQALDRLLKGIELENAFLLEELLALKAAAFEAEMARVMAELNAMMNEARLAELTLRRRKRDEEAMAILLLSDI